MFGKIIACAIGAMFWVNLGSIIVMMAADMASTAAEIRRMKKQEVKNVRG